MKPSEEPKRSGIERKGRVIRLASRGCVAEGEDGSTFRCEVRGAAKRKTRKEKHLVAVGDIVRFSVTSPGEGVIEEVAPRETVFSRRAPGKRLDQVLAANADAVLVITSTQSPPFRPGLVDRVLIAAERGELEGWVCLNKVDLAPAADFQETLSAYRAQGYRIFATSAVTGEGVKELEEALERKLVVLIGHSGVGKSSLLKRIQPDLALKVRPVSVKTGRGVHTTTTPKMLRIGREAHVIDTPGIREFMPSGITPDSLWWFYPEMRDLGEGCRFRDCRHTKETGCEVLKAVEEKRIDRGRYDRYLRILASLLERT